ncbi:MAG: flavin reductase, partial [Treponema sp.]|nr:flavin reductase [Treponema sp.]
YLNAGAYSAGVFSVNPFRIIIGVKSYVTAEEFRKVESFTVALGNRSQVDNVWVTAFHAPPGIDEIELADWHPLDSAFIKGPGIAECPVNLECRTVDLIKLPHPWRTIVIAEIVGASVDEAYVKAPRGETLSQLPLHEGGMHIEDAFYGLSTMSGELSNPASAAKGNWSVKDGKVRAGGKDLYAPENAAVLANCVFPRPSYIVVTKNDDGTPCLEAFSMGFIQSTEPAVHVPIKKESATWKNVQRDKRFTVSIPTLADLEKFDELKKNAGTSLCGFTLAEPNMFGIPSVAECPISIDCDAYMVEDIPGADYALLLGIKVGATMDANVGEMLDQTSHPPRENMAFMNDLYSRFIYKAFDVDMTEKTVHYDMNSTVPIKNIPVWGSRYLGAWWGEVPTRMYFWLIELCQMKILTKREFEKIHNELIYWNNGKGVEHLKSYYKSGDLENCRERLTKLLKAMVWAGRDMWRWDRVHALLDTLPDPYLFHNHHSGPMYYEAWSTDQYV